MDCHDNDALSSFDMYKDANDVDKKVSASPNVCGEYEMCLMVVMAC